MSGQITNVELARRLCVAAHRVPAVSPPCSAHLMEANRMWGLIGPAGQKQLHVLVDAAKENGAWTD
jgi:hypothetical protein